MIGCVALLAAVLAAFALAGPGIAVLAGLLLAFFAAFNVLEALLPSLVSRIAPAHARGAAIGVYNTAQTLGLFFGGVGGGWIAGHFGASRVFGACAVLSVAWLAMAAGMRAPRRAQLVNPAGG
jgi:MFS family permease